ncbi:MAG TPA: hypothetical protein VFA62_04960, partial [Acidimicrobiia bacterium]|nr:hypothetical protein [Acidimicrobiia bacterium]
IPSSLEFPDGTVERVGVGARAEDIAALVQRLIDDPERRRALRDRGLAYARSWSHDHVASRIVEMIGHDVATATRRHRVA